MRTINDGTGTIGRIVPVGANWRAEIYIRRVVLWDIYATEGEAESAVRAARRKA